MTKAQEEIERLMKRIDNLERELMQVLTIQDSFNLQIIKTICEDVLHRDQAKNQKRR